MENKYAKIDMETLNRAMSSLSPEGLTLWLYFSKNAPGYEFSLNSKHCLSVTTLSEYKYKKAIKELIDKGYLIKTKKIYPEGKQPIYIFCENTRHKFEQKYIDLYGI